ncbi:hypothetical protein [Streptomyces sp. NPDC048106]|uniref:hypothetical protein n=1 Tax=Streptomyces sp. NPDC048106 TaxID=3155750 RepID=UPI0034564628
MARHSKPQYPTARRALFALVTAGAALGAGAATAHADAAAPHGKAPGHSAPLGDIDPQAGLTALAGSAGYATEPVAGLKPNPLAGTGVDPLDNGVGTRVADFKPVDSRMLTAPVAEAKSVGEVPVAGRLVSAPGN